MRPACIVSGTRGIVTRDFISEHLEVLFGIEQRALGTFQFAFLNDPHSLGGESGEIGADGGLGDVVAGSLAILALGFLAVIALPDDPAFALAFVAANEWRRASV